LVNVAQPTASGYQVEVQQDLLSISMSTTVAVPTPTW
jgi:hypothetical protein